MITQHDFIRLLFNYSVQQGLSCALARPSIQGNDLDLLIDTRHVSPIIDWIKIQKDITLTSVYQRQDGWSAHMHGIETSRGFSFHIDFITALTFKSIPYLSVHEVLNRAEGKQNMALLHPIDLSLILLLTHGMRHGGELKDYNDYIAKTYYAYPTAFGHKLIETLGVRQGLETIDAIKENRCDRAWAQKSRRAYLDQAFAKHPFQTAVFWLGHHIREIILRFRAPKIIFAFYGIDGAGKTTLINALRPHLTDMARHVRYCHFLPVFPWQREPDSTRTLKNPHDRQNRSALISIAKLGWLWGYYWAAFLWPWQGSVLFVFDRYGPDLCVDPRRFRYGAPHLLARIFAKLLPRADSSVLVDISANIAQQRKSEVPMTEAQRQTVAYRMEMARLPNPLIVKGIMPLEQMTSLTLLHFFQILRQKT
jgi:hypothetical protein